MGNSIEYESYIKRTSKYDIFLAKHMVSQLARIKKYLEKEKGSGFFELATGYDLAKVIRLLGYVALLIHYPIFIVPYARLGKTWRICN